MPLEVVTGAPFSGKDRWIAAEIERREAAGELGLVALNYTTMYSAIAPGTESVYRDDAVSASGAPRLAGYLLAAAISEAAARELDGYIAVDSPRRAIAALEKTGGRHVFEVSISEGTAHRRAAEHLTLLRSIAPRSAAAAISAVARCRRVVRAYFAERNALDVVDVRQVRAPDLPSDNAIRYAWTAAIRASKHGDVEAKAKWIDAAKRMLAARGIEA